MQIVLVLSAGLEISTSSLIMVVNVMFFKELQALKNDIWKTQHCALPDVRSLLIHRPPVSTEATSYTKKKSLYENYWCGGLWIILSNRDIVSGNCCVLFWVFFSNYFEGLHNQQLICIYSQFFSSLFLLPEAFSKLRYLQKDLVYCQLQFLFVAGSTTASTGDIL